jgi:hypothetical protein
MCMETVIGQLPGAIFGFLVSLLTWIFTERVSSPKLEIVVDEDRGLGQFPGNPPHEFYHVRVRNVLPKYRLHGRKPAWACRATIEVFRPDGGRVIADDVIARWTSQPEPLLPVVAQGEAGYVLDPARLTQARRVDVHSHSDERIPLVLKFEGERDCYIFSNESYRYQRLHQELRNPDWRIPPGRYRLRVTVQYERGQVEKDLEFSNEGPSRYGVHLNA